MDSFKEYIDTVCGYIENKKDIAGIEIELNSHLLDKTDRIMSWGFDEETASKRAVLEMGDPSTVGKNLNLVYRKMMLKAIISTIPFWIISIILVFIIMDHSFAYINLVDWEETNSVSDFCSTLLFVNVSLFFALAYKQKNTLLFGSIGTFLVVPVLIPFFPGFFQPAFYNIMSLLTEYWGNDRPGSEAFSGIPGGMLLGFALAIINLFAHFSIGIYSFAMISKIRAERQALGNLRTKTAKRVKKALFITSIILLVGISISTFIYYKDISREPTENEMYFYQQNVEELEEAYEIYNSIGEEDIILPPENQLKHYQENRLFNGMGIFVSTYVQVSENIERKEHYTYDEMEKEKRIWGLFCGTASSEQLKTVKEGMSKEEFLKILPFETFGDIRCRYLPNGDIIEEYNYFETSPIYSLNYWVIIKNDIVEKIDSDKEYEMNF